MKNLLTTTLGLTLLAMSTTSGWTQTVSPVQSAARPFGLSIAGPVYVGGSDAKSADFMKTELPQMMKFINANLSETKALASVSSVALDPTKLKLTTDAEVRVYFVGEGAGYWNTLGYNPTGIGIKSGSPTLIFPNASSQATWLGASNTATGNRTTSTPLMPGDFVNLGTLTAGQTLDFFLIADGAQVPQKNRVWTAYQSYNSDGLQHMASFANPNSAYLLMSFEDLTGGGDKDYNDLVFAVEIGYKNVQALANPEPSTLLTFGLLAGVAFYVRRRLNGRTEGAFA